MQRDLLTRFHVTDAQDVLLRQDFWQVPNDPAQEGTGPQAAAVLPARRSSPGRPQPTFQLVTAMTSTAAGRTCPR